MSYPYFFVSGNAVRGDFIFITDEDYSHLVKVLRAKPGDAVGVSDSATTRYETIIQSIDNDSATLRVLSSRPIKRRKPEIHLYLCFLKKDAMELAIQKNTEIGIDVIIPVHSSRVVVEISGKKKESRLLRWRQIAYNASKQSKRSFFCRVSDPVVFTGVKPDDYDLFFLLHEEPSKGTEKVSLTGLLDCFTDERLKKMEKIAFITGPEGGFENKEVNHLMDLGATGVNFGQNILRAETASLYFASVIDFLLKLSNG